MKQVQFLILVLPCIKKDFTNTIDNDNVLEIFSLNNKYRTFDPGA